MMHCETPSTGKAAEFAAQMRTQVPRLETDRLILRAPEIEDFSYYAEITLGARGAYLLDDPSRENAWYDFTQMISAWMLRGFGLWTADLKESGDVAGFVLLGFEPGDHEPELGYMFRTCAEGRGLAAEAAIAARAYGFETLGLPSLVSTIDPENTRSRALAKRLGAVRDADAEAAHQNSILVYRHTPAGPSESQTEGNAT